MNDLPFVTCSRLLRHPQTTHAFTTRSGGVSDNEYASLNCSFNSGDRHSRVLENRNRVTQALGVHALVSLKQVHSNRVLVVDREWDHDRVQEGDGLVTRETGIALGVLVADCAPVLFSDPAAGVVGAAHAGWKGALDGITDSVIARMLDLGANPKNMIAAVGPAIQQHSYEVGLDFVKHFAALSPIACDQRFEIGRNSARFDLPGYLVQRIRHSGVRRIDCLDADTYAMETEFFSYRRMCHQGARHYGRQMGVISILEA